MNKRQSPLQVQVGDTVEIYLTHSDEPPFLATADKIDDRTTSGEGAALLHYTRHDGKPEKVGTPCCDISYVSKIISRAPLAPRQPARPINIYRDQLERDRKKRNWLGHDKISRGIMRGISITHLVSVALASAVDELTRPLNEERIQALWYAQKPGFIPHANTDSLYDHRPHVHWKVFKRWALRNRHRLMASGQEMRQWGRENQEVWARTYEEDMIADWDNDPFFQTEADAKEIAAAEEWMDDMEHESYLYEMCTKDC
jgi:hypothetical protein